MTTPGIAGIVFHEGSGRGRASALVPLVESRLRAAGWTVEAEAKTEYEGHAQEALVPELASLVDLIVVIGGDGMVREVSAGLAAGDRRPAVGLVPTGNANVVARELKIPLEARRAVDLLTTGGSRPVDLGRLRTREDSGEWQYFLAMVEVGFVAQVVHVAHRLRNGPLKGVYRLSGSPVYLAAVVEALRSPGDEPFSIRANGEDLGKGWRGAVLANTRCYAKSWCIAEDARIDDGWLDLVARRKTGARHLLRTYLAAARARTPRGGPGMTRRSHKFILESENAMMIQVDGDPFPPADWMEVGLIPGAVQILSPLETPP
jgi:diacylglycerol kinase family enzyme